MTHVDGMCRMHKPFPAQMHMLVEWRTPAGFDMRATYS